MRLVSVRIIIFLALCSGAGNLFAQPNTLYFLPGVPQTKDLNPARPGIEKGFYISMPLFAKLDLSMNTNNWSFTDLIHRGTGAMSDSLVWDFKNYLSVLGKENFVMESASLTLFEAGWKRETDFFAFSWTEHELGEFFFNRNLVNILYYGNAPYLGSTIHSGYFGLGAQNYRELAFTYAKKMNKKLTLGITGKLLFGMAGVKTSGLNVVAGMPVNGNQIDLGAGGKVFISAPVDIQIQNIKNNGNQFSSKNNFKAGRYFTNLRNPGLAVDLGFSTKVNDKFEFSMSMIDLGFISWRKDISSFTFDNNGYFKFRGINLNTITPTNNPPTTTDVKSLFVEVSDSLANAFLPVKSTNKFITLLPVKLYAAGQYQINKEITLGGVARIRMFNNMLHTSFTASANAALSKKLTMSASYSLMESTTDNLGLAAAYRIGIVQVYAASDNVLSFYRPGTARNMNLRVGINLIFQDGSNQKGLYKREGSRSAPGCKFEND
jgi:hypothetical protein